MTEKERLSETAIANKRRYNAEYYKEHYKGFNVSLPVEEYNEIMKYIKDLKLTRVEFIRNVFKYIKENNVKF